MLIRMLSFCGPRPPANTPFIGLCYVILGPETWFDGFNGEQKGDRKTAHSHLVVGVLMLLLMMRMRDDDSDDDDG